MDMSLFRHFVKENLTNMIKCSHSLSVHSQMHLSFHASVTSRSLDVSPFLRGHNEEYFHAIRKQRQP